MRRFFVGRFARGDRVIASSTASHAQETTAIIRGVGPRRAGAPVADAQVTDHQPSLGHRVARGD